MYILFGKQLTNSKQIRYALTNLFGIGFTNANKICNLLNIPVNVKVSELTELQKQLISTFIKKTFLIEAKLKQKVRENIETLIDINCRKGFRHRLKLPVRGQRTHSNAKTCKRIFF